MVILKIIEMHLSCFENSMMKILLWKWWDLCRKSP